MYARQWTYESIPNAVVFTFGLAVTLGLTFLTHYAISQDRGARFDQATRHVLNNIQSRISAYVGALEDTRSLFVIHPETTRDQFHRFVQTMNLPRKYPGSLGLSFVPLVTGDRLKPHVSAVRKELPSYHVWPTGRRPVYSSILYIEPLNPLNSGVIGYDMMSEPVRREAMERARDTGQPAMSKKVTLLRGGPSLPAGFILYVPIFRDGIIPKSVAKRREALIGYVSSAFRAQDLFRDATGELTIDGILGVEIFDGPASQRSQASVLFDDDDTDNGGRGGAVPAEAKAAAHPNALSNTVQLDVAGTPWTVSFTPGPSFERGLTATATWYVFFVGSLVTILLCHLWSGYESYNNRLRESEARLRQVTDSLPALIALIGSDGIYQFANAAHAEWFGLSPAQATGKTLETVLASSADETSSQIARTSFDRARRGERVSFEMRIHHQTRGLRRVKVEGIPRTEQRAFFGAEYGGTPPVGGMAADHDIVALATDITDTARLLEALKESESKYRATASENELLYKQAQHLNRAKDDFLATLSHELRTPLTVILGNAELLKEGIHLSPEASESIDSILRNARSQNQIVSDLIDISSIITGKITLQMNIVPVREMIAGAIESVRPAAEAKGVTLESQIRDDAAFVRGDANRLQQIALNLLTNAIKFTPVGGHIEVTGRLAVNVERLLPVSEPGEAASGESRGGEYEIRVRDSGRGIDADFLPYVFDRFRQEDNSMTRQHGGLGLGLSIVRNLVEAHQGTVEARSRGRDQGAEFIVRIPAQLAPASEMEGGLRSVSARSGHMANQLLASKQILIVDDEPDARRLIARYLERAGAQVHPAGSVREALAALANFTPDLIISDIGMPGEDGYTFMRRVRSHELLLDRERVPAIALTAYAREEDRQQAFQAGYQAHLPKPVGSARLAEVARQMIHAPPPA